MFSREGGSRCGGASKLTQGASLGLTEWRYNPLRHTTMEKHYIPSILTSSNKNIFRVTGQWWGQSTGHRPPPPILPHTHSHITHHTTTQHTPSKHTEKLVTRSFDFSAPEQSFEQAIGTPLIETPSRSLWRHCNNITSIIRSFHEQRFPIMFFLRDAYGSFLVSSELTWRYSSVKSLCWTGSYW